MQKSYDWIFGLTFRIGNGAMLTRFCNRHITIVIVRRIWQTNDKQMYWCCSSTRKQLAIRGQWERAAWRYCPNWVRIITFDFMTDRRYFTCDNYREINRFWFLFCVLQLIDSMFYDYNFFRSNKSNDGDKGGSHTCYSLLNNHSNS